MIFLIGLFQVLEHLSLSTVIVVSELITIKILVICETIKAISRIEEHDFGHIAQPHTVFSHEMLKIRCVLPTAISADAFVLQPHTVLDCNWRGIV